MFRTTRIAALAAVSAFVLAAQAEKAEAVALNTPVDFAFFAQSTAGNLFTTDPVFFGETAATGGVPVETANLTVADFVGGFEVFLTGSATGPGDPTSVIDPFVFTFDVDNHTFTYSVPPTDGGTGPQIPGGSLGSSLEFDDGDFIGFELSFGHSVIETVGDNPSGTGFTFDPTAPDFSSSGIASRLDLGTNTFSLNTVEAFADATGAELTFDLKVQNIPLPAPMLLLLSGLAGLAVIGARKTA